MNMPTESKDCPKCGTRIHLDEHCPKCSIVSYVKQCPKCGASSPGNADYCHDCGYGPPVPHSHTPRFDAAYAECLDDTGKITRLEPLYNLCRRLEFETRQAACDGFGIAEAAWREGLKTGHSTDNYFPDEWWPKSKAFKAKGSQ